ncbi:unnamed protein product, partial [Linum tenue]
MEARRLLILMCLLILRMLSLRLAVLLQTTRAKWLKEMVLGRRSLLRSLKGRRIKGRRRRRKATRTRRTTMEISLTRRRKHSLEWMT